MILSRQYQMRNSLHHHHHHHYMMMGFTRGLGTPPLGTMEHIITCQFSLGQPWRHNNRVTCHMRCHMSHCHTVTHHTCDVHKYHHHCGVLDIWGKLEPRVSRKEVGSGWTWIIFQISLQSFLFVFIFNSITDEGPCDVWQILTYHIEPWVLR